jgi:hypothetical protein
MAIRNCERGGMAGIILPLVCGLFSSLIV